MASNGAVAATVAPRRTDVGVHDETRSDAVMRIAMVCPYSLSRPGGVQGQAIDLSRALGRLGHHVTLFAPIDDDHDRPAGVDLVATGRSVALPANGSVAPVTLSPLAVARATARLRTDAYDVVHLHEPFTPGVPYGALLDWRLPPLVGTFHRSGDSPFYRMLRPVTTALARRLAARVAVSEAARETAANALGGTYETLFNGIDLDAFVGVDPWPCAVPSILFLGRHEERKGVVVLIEAMARLLESWPADDTLPALWMAGDGPLTGQLRERVAAHSLLASQVSFLGVISEQEKVRRLLGADVLAAPSLGGESFGLILLEALAAGTTVVASAIPGYEAAAGGLAVLAEPGAVDAWSDVLAGALRGEGQGAWSDPWREAAAARAERWSMAALADAYASIYRDVVERSR